MRRPHLSAKGTPMLTRRTVLTGLATGMVAPSVAYGQTVWPPLFEHPQPGAPDPFAGLENFLGYSCCHGRDCRLCPENFLEWDGSDYARVYIKELDKWIQVPSGLRTAATPPKGTVILCYGLFKEDGPLARGPIKKEWYITFHCFSVELTA